MIAVLRRAVVWALVVLGGAAVLAAGVHLFTQRDSTEQDRHDVQLIVAVLSVSADPDALRGAVARTEAGADGRMVLRFADGSVIGTTPRPGTPTTVSTVDAVDGSQVRLEVTPGPSRLPLLELLVFLAVLGLAGWVGVAVACRVFRPVITAVCSLTEAASNGQRVVLHGPAELVALADAITATADHADQSIVREREVIADVSHRLRTPLTALRLDADAIGDSAAAHRVRVSVIAMERDVDRIIRSFSTTPNGNVDRCDLATVVAHRMAFWSAHAELQGRDCDLSLPSGDTPVRLSRDTVEAVVDTLLDNIFQHTPAPAPLSVEVVRHAGWVRLVVEDGGTGIADTEAALRRGSSARGSTGLGLAIARAAAEATGGGVRVDRGRLGGARIRLSFNEDGRSAEPEGPRAWRLWTSTHRMS